MELSLTETIFRKEMRERLDADFDEFIHYQKLVLDTLDAFSRVCNNRHIDYYLAYGTLLGAIRDKGQIPWDYDIDVWVKQEDIERLISALDKELPDDYYYVTRYKSKEHRHYMMRVSPKGYSSEVLHVDVFWLFEAPTNISKLNKMKRLYDRNRLWGQLKRCPEKYLTWKQNKILRMFFRLKRLMISFIPNWYIDKLHKKAVSMIDKNSLFYSDEYGILFDKKYFEQVQITSLVNGMTLSVPSGYDGLLKQLYGNYSNYLSINERMEEFERSLCRIRELGKVD